MIEKDIKYRCPNCRGESLDISSGVWYCVLCNYHLKDRSEMVIEEWISKDSLHNYFINSEKKNWTWQELVMLLEKLK